MFGLDWNGIRDKIYFLFFLANLNLVQIEIIAKWSFLIFWKFLLFFWEFSCLGREGTKFGTKFFAIFLRIFLPGSSMNKIWDEIFFFLFHGLYQPGLDRNIAGTMFFNFYNFFDIFLGIFSPGSGCNGIQHNFFSLFLGLSHPVLAKNNVGKRFYNFFNFFAIFLSGSSMNGIRE